MSKAFTRESDDLPEKPLTRPIQSGQKDYLTPDGAQRLGDELKQLSESPERESPPAKQRISQLQEVLGTAEVVPVPAQPWEQVLFGASVTVRDAHGVESRYRIVGREEADLDRNWVSWTSPIARALLKSRVGQQIRFRIPAGEHVWDIVRIEYH
ncbi:MAG TPA: GreA/GreB family elongation factor [Verrucomicrobiae bacterium]|nr:GreA/GreB family elongation factor [Verrucomicrobiae bacterium]